jgi:hypothetical protein
MQPKPRQLERHTILVVGDMRADRPIRFVKNAAFASGIVEECSIFQHSDFDIFTNTEPFVVGNPNLLWL